MNKYCPCCNELYTSLTPEPAMADIWNDGQVLEYCSWECIEHLSDEYQETMMESED